MLGIRLLAKSLAIFLVAVSPVSLFAGQDRTPFDFDGDGKADVSVFRPSEGNWYALRSTAGFMSAHWGISSDRLTPADYDADGKTDLAVFRRGENSTWYILNSADSTFRAAQWGASTLEQPILFDTPVPADYDGDGKADLAIWRLTDNLGEPARFLILQSTNGAGRAQQWGIVGDSPVPSDFDGDLKTDLGVYRSGVWWILGSSDGVHTATHFGLADDKTVAADYDGDGRSDLAVYRELNGSWYVLGSTVGFIQQSFGLSTDLPTPADFDGDRKTDFAVYRGGVWHILGSLSGYQVRQFGLSDDQPIPGVYVR